MKVFGDGSHAVLEEDLVFGFCRPALDGNGVVVVLHNIDDLVRVMVVVPGSDDVFRTHEVEGVEVIVGCNRCSVGPLGVWMQSVINGFSIVVESPMCR